MLLRNKMTKAEKDLYLWSRYFRWCLKALPWMILGGFPLQASFTWHSLSLDPTNLINWVEFRDVFSLPINFAAAAIAITTLVGLYHRSLQLAVQLEKVEQQLIISNNQFKKSEQQFLLSQNQLKIAQEQYKLNQKKESFALFVEHKKYIKNVFEEIFEKYKLSKNEDNIFQLSVFHDVLYKSLFPSNSTNEILDLDIESNSFKLKENLKALNTVLLYIDKEKGNIKPGIFIDAILSNLGYFGLAFNTGVIKNYYQTYDDLDSFGLYLFFDELATVTLCFIKVSKSKAIARKNRAQCSELSQYYYSKYQQELQK